MTDIIFECQQRRDAATQRKQALDALTEETNMTKMTKTLHNETIVNAIRATKAASEANAKKKSAIILLAQRDSVAAFMHKCNVNTSFFNDLYIAEKIVKACATLSATDVSVRDFNENTFAALKTCVLCFNASADVTRAQLRACIAKVDYKALSEEMQNLTYVRANHDIASRQKDMNVNLIRALRIADFRDSKEILRVNKDSHALKVCVERIADMTL